MNVWRLTTHHIDREYALEWAKREGKLALGWGHIGDILAQGYNSPEAILDAIREVFPLRPSTRTGGPCLYDFCYAMKPGDLVILSTSKRREVVMEVDSGYYFKHTPEAEPVGIYQH